MAAITDEEIQRRWFDRLAGAGEPVESGRSLNFGSGGGTSDDMPDETLKSRVDFLHTAFLWLAGAIVTVALGVIGTIVVVSNASNARADRVVEAVGDLRGDIAQLSTKTEEANKRLDRIETKIDRIGDKLGG